jgi:hypothetical protein
MAVSVDNVYQKVLAICNKEQRGYITPQEFNLFADKAQNEIYNNYFHGIKMAEMKPKTQTVYSDTLEMLEEKLQPFFVTATANTSTSNLTLPSGTHKLISIETVSDARTAGNKITPLNESEFEYANNNPLTKPTMKRSVYVRQGSSVVSIYPTPTTTTYNVDTSTPADGVFDAESFVVKYYKVPSTPKWTYVVVNEEALYNSTASDANDFDLHGGEEENLVSRILMLAGITIQKPDIQQAGITDINLTRQQQNS